MRKVEPKESPKFNFNLDIPQDDEGVTMDEAFAKIAMILGETKRPKILSELDDYEIKLCAALYSVSEKTKNKLVSDFLDNFLLLRVSHHRQGRKELLEIAKAGRENSESRMNKLKQMIGMGNR